MHFEDQGTAVRITAIDMSMADLTRLFLKIAVALIPALVILSLAWVLIGGLLMLTIAPFIHGIAVGF